MARISRRDFQRRAALVLAGPLRGFRQEESRAKSIVALARGPARVQSLRRIWERAGSIDLRGKDVYLKGDFNSADPYPASTHPDTLREVIRLLREQGCGRIHLVERSGMGVTREILDRLGMFQLARELDILVLPLDELPAQAWRAEALPQSHWKQGIEVPRFLGAGRVLVQICNLKTHRFGGYFSASLKNSIGLIAKQSVLRPPYNYMAELHSSTHQRLMIAEVNQVFQPELVVMDATEVFIEGGPERGEIATPDVVAVSKDRVAIDALGVALLRIHGAGPPLSKSVVFEQEQIKRAAELGLGCASGREISFESADEGSATLSGQITGLLLDTPDEKKN